MLLMHGSQLSGVDLITPEISLMTSCNWISIFCVCATAPHRVSILCYTIAERGQKFSRRWACRLLPSLYPKVSWWGTLLTLVSEMNPPGVVGMSVSDCDPVIPRYLGEGSEGKSKPFAVTCGLFSACQLCRSKPQNAELYKVIKNFYCCPMGMQRWREVFLSTRICLQENNCLWKISWLPKD